MLGKNKDSATKPCMFVLDTNVFIHDPSSILRFEEHDVYVPMQVLEELDDNKKGHSEVARNARTASNIISTILSGDPADISKGISLESASQGMAVGRLFIQAEDCSDEVKADNRILDAVKKLAEEVKDREVVLVSKDLNMRIKGRAQGIRVEDYHNDKVIEDTDLLYSGSRILPSDFWDTQGEQLESWNEGGATHYRVHGSLVDSLHLNEFVCLPGDEGLHTRVIQKGDNKATLRTVYDYQYERNNVWGITARNTEQNYALNLLLDPEIDIVTLTGQAGTGKTLLTLAAGLKLTVDNNCFSEIIMTRVTMPLGEDIGFLPGTEEDKMNPWMGALDDNLDVLHKDAEAGEWGRAATRDILRSRIKVKSLNFMRGRTFLKKFLIIDEVQNLTSKQVKALITRAGPGTKVVCLGNLAQIDTPYLTEGSSGLAYLVDRFKGWEHSGHITLHAGERSRLSSYANEVL